MLSDQQAVHQLAHKSEEQGVNFLSYQGTTLGH